MVSAVDQEPFAAEASRRLAQLEAVAADLDAVEAALGALDDGTYGRCRHCGQPLPDDLLARDPLAGDCGRHPWLRYEEGQGGPTTAGTRSAS
jgi:RNA polymerase-binding transcription factor DksA